MDPEKYKLAVQEAKGLLVCSKDQVSTSEREMNVEDVIKRIYFGKNGDVIGLRNVASSVIRLMQTYPLTVQQLGTVVRAQRHLKEMQWNKGGRFELKKEELMTVQVGDWEKIKNVFNLLPERKMVWEESTKKNIASPQLLTIYRGMDIDDKDMEVVREFGLVPEGLRRYQTVDEVVFQQIKFFWGCENWPNTNPRRMCEWLLGKIPFSTVNLLHEVYEEGDFGTSSPFKLGISTTTPDNLKKRTRRFFGNYLIRIQMPGNLLLKTHDKPSEDECTVMYYIPPEAITGHAHVPENNLEPLIKKLPPHSRYKNIFAIGRNRD